MAGIIEHFGNLPDPRTKEHKIQHKLIDIVFIAIAAFSGALRYTFGLTDFAVNLLLGRKYRPYPFHLFFIY